MTSLLPWFANHTLNQRERKRVADAVRRQSEIANDLQVWQMLAGKIKEQPQGTPSDQAYTRLQARLQKLQPAASRPSALRNWKMQTAAFLALALSVFILLWLVIQPGMVLEWSADGQIKAFHVYRATPGSAHYSLVGELPADHDTGRYSYVDSLLLPGQEFTYMVEGLQPNGQTTKSQPLQGNTLAALPAQAALLLTSLLMAAALLLIIQNLSFKIRPNQLWMA